MLFLSSGESRGTRAERCFCFSPLESREVHERRGREESFGDAASSSFSNASPVVPTDRLQSFVKPISNKALLRFALPRCKRSIIRECMLLHAIGRSS